MTAQEILAEIKPLGRDSYRNVLFNHGIAEPCYGVKIDELKKITTPDQIRHSNRRKIGPVNVDVGNTSCQVPFAPDYIQKAEKCGVIGKKRKTVKC